MSDTYLPNRAGEAARRVDALKAENDRLRAELADDELLFTEAHTALEAMLAALVRHRTAIAEALTAMKDPERTNGECLSVAHYILSRVMADEPTTTFKRGTE